MTEGIKGDPHFNTLAPLRFGSVRTPSGRLLSINTERSITVRDKLDPLSLKTITETFSVNGRSWYAVCGITEDACG